MVFLKGIALEENFYIYVWCFLLSDSAPGVFVPFSLYLAIFLNLLYNKFYIVLLYSVKLVMSKLAVP